MAWLRGSIVSAALFVAAGVTAPAVAGTVHFVVAERPELAEHGDSFILPLSEPDDIAHARDLIARGPEAAGAPLVFAEVVAGSDGVNRDVLADGEPLWSWHVSAFEGFGDMGIELVDGWPTYVESDVQGWIENTNRDEGDPRGHIGFWNYTVVAEVGAPPVGVPLPGALPAGLLGLAAFGVCRRRFGNM